MPVLFIRYKSSHQTAMLPSSTNTHIPFRSLPIERSGFTASWKEKQKQMSSWRSKVQTKDEVLAELMAEHMA